jgi:hypothetical protein
MIFNGYEFEAFYPHLGAVFADKQEVRKHRFEMGFKAIFILYYRELRRRICPIPSSQKSHFAPCNHLKNKDSYRNIFVNFLYPHSQIKRFLFDA